MTARSQVEKLRCAADRAASVARENKRLVYAISPLSRKASDTEIA
jgi:hypothetical protein